MCQNKKFQAGIFCRKTKFDTAWNYYDYILHAILATQYECVIRDLDVFVVEWHEILCVEGVLSARVDA